MVMQFPDIDRTGAPLPTAENVERLLMMHSAVALKRGNTINLGFSRLETRYLNPAPWAAKWGWLTSECAKAGLPDGGLEEHLFYLAARGPHPLSIAGGSC